MGDTTMWDTVMTIIIMDIVLVFTQWCKVHSFQGWYYF